MSAHWLGADDLVVRGRRIATASGTIAADIVVKVGRVAALLPHGTARSDRTIDVEERLVLPGLIDSHVHVRDPGQTDKEDFHSASSAAAASGITTMMCMPNTDPLLIDRSAFEATAEAARRSRVDVALQALAHPASLKNIPELARLGVVSFEMFLGGGLDSLVTHERRDQAALLRAIAAIDGVVGLYPTDTSVSRELAAGGPADADAIARRYPPMLETGSLLPALALATSVDCRVHFRQMSSELSAIAVAWARRRGIAGRLTTEVTPHHLVLNIEHLRRHGPEAHIMPPLREVSDVESLWLALRSGEIDAIATDHAPHRQDEKTQGRMDLSKCPPGFPGLETFLPVILTEMRRRNLDESVFVRLTATNPARLFGIYPRKGVIAPGSDADLVVVEDDSEWSIAPDAFYSKARYSPFAGFKARAQAVMTMVRGTVVYDNGEFTGPTAHGELVRRMRPISQDL